MGNSIRDGGILNSTGPEQGPVIDFCDDGDRSSGSITAGDFHLPQEDRCHGGSKINFAERCIARICFISIARVDESRAVEHYLGLYSLIVKLYLKVISRNISVKSKFYVPIVT
jgi:hypothetical protein